MAAIHYILGVALGLGVLWLVSYVDDWLQAKEKRPSE